MHKIYTSFKDIVRPAYWFVKNWRHQLWNGQAWLKNYRTRPYYTRLNVDNWIIHQRSDTIFIFGSGYSLNEMSADEWAFISQHDTMGFNWFSHQNFVRVDYHVGREITTLDNWDVFFAETRKYARLINDNPFYKDTVLLLQGGWKAFSMNSLVGLKLLRSSYRILRFKNVAQPSMESLPTKKLDDGVVHYLGTLSDCINFAYIGGWKQIILVGVDLYDRRYFWLNEDELRNHPQIQSYETKEKNADGKISHIDRKATIHDAHRTALFGIVQFMGVWHDYLNTKNVQLWCYNPHSLLVEHLPIYNQTGITK